MEGEYEKKRNCVNSDCVPMSECTCHGDGEEEVQMNGSADTSTSLFVGSFLSG